MMKALLALILFAAQPALSLSDQDNAEIKFASEGAPKHITENASFMKFENNKFVRIVKGKNNFTCLVVREPKGRFEPSCFNEQARRSILPTYELHMSLLVKGFSNKEVYTKIGLAFDKGELPGAETGSLVYMMSSNNRTSILESGKFYPTPVHQMFYYPRLKDEVFSLKGSTSSLWQGFPHLSALVVAL